MSTYLTHLISPLLKKRGERSYIKEISNPTNFVFAKAFYSSFFGPP
jgi:hypothetical protein